VHRIHAHVALSVLALLLERVIEQACGDTWRTIRADVDQIKLAGLDHGIGHFMLFEVDSVARAPVPPILKSRQTASAASDRKTAPQPSSRQAG
jgi:hypothetical protein